MGKIVIVGAGGLGTPASWGITSAWQDFYPETQLAIYDPDALEISNLNRQVLYKERDIGRPKAELLKEALTPLKNLHISSHTKAITKENISDALIGASYVIEGSDSTETKFLINDYCVANKIPFCYGGAIADRGLLLEVLPGENHTPCLRCLFGDFSKKDFDEQNTTCQQAGIYGPVAGLVGFYQAEAAIKYLTGKRSPTTKLLRFKMDQISESKIEVDSECPHLAVKLDLSDKVCPSTFLYTKLMLEKLEIGTKLEVYFDCEESAKNVSRTMDEMGHGIEGYEREGELWRLDIRKGG